MNQSNKHDNLNVLIVADNASARFGGEAILPLHYFRFMIERQINVRLLVHERCKNELFELFPNQKDRIHFVPDTKVHRLFWKLGDYFPYRIRNFTFDLVGSLLTQFMQRKIAKKLIEQFNINILHQPIPVSPKQPSMMFNLDSDNQTKIIIGPMNGGMDYPSAFKKQSNRKRAIETVFIDSARLCSSYANVLIPGKRRADLLLVTNQRTHDALPSSVKHDEQARILHMHENAVIPEHWPAIDWNERLEPAKHNNHPRVKAVFLGRLQYLKAVDTLIDAIHKLDDDVYVKLDVIGDGEAKSNLEKQTDQLNLADQIRFHGFVPQTQCASLIKNADVLVLPSIHECGGAVVLEAMCMQLPVIVADWGGPADYVTPECGFRISVESRDTLVNGIANALKQLAENPSLREKLGHAGRERVLEHFNWPIKIDRMLEIYQQQLQQ
ncbi:glycosyltransferase family 4 protein [Planctomycetota bacterium]|nr:glycosyltransferase family 4 protein [Planctomycetota bacterium]